MSLTSQARTTSALLEANHQTTLAEFLGDQREQGRSYERIAKELHILTDGVVSVTRETIRNWINELEAVA